MYIVKLAAVAIGVMIAAGCIDIDYAGQSYEPDPRREVKWFNTAQEVPADTYHIAGRATASCSSDRNQLDVRDALIEEAEARGMDAIQVVSSGEKITKVAHLREGGFSEFGSNSMEARRDGVWTPFDSFGQEQTRRVRQVEIKEFHANVYFLVYKKRYQDAMEQFQAARRPLIETEPLRKSETASEEAAPATQSQAPAQPAAAQPQITPPAPETAQEINKFLDQED